MGSRRETDDMLKLTPDEEAVILAMRITPYGEVIAEMRMSEVINIRRHETIKPPSLSTQPELLSKSRP